MLLLCKKTFYHRYISRLADCTPSSCLTRRRCRREQKRLGRCSMVAHVDKSYGYANSRNGAERDRPETRVQTRTLILSWIRSPVRRPKGHLFVRTRCGGVRSMATDWNWRNVIAPVNVPGRQQMPLRTIVIKFYLLLVHAETG